MTQMGGGLCAMCNVLRFAVLSLLVLTTIMVKSCIAAGCSNQLKDGVSLFKFPTEKNLRLKWTRQVQRTRAEWKGPTNNSYVCSKHFTEDCFQPLSVMSARMGMSMKQMLKPDAIPTIFHKPNDKPASARRHSSAYEK